MGRQHIPRGGKKHGGEAPPPMSFKDSVNFRIRELGFKKKFLAEKIGLTPSEFSHMMKGSREYPREKHALLVLLGIKEYLAPPIKKRHS